MSKACLEELYAKLKKKSEACLTRNNRLFIVGGSKDMLLPLLDCYKMVENSLVCIFTIKLQGIS